MACHKIKNNIIFFGVSGVGKSSLINALTGSSFRTGNSLFECTTKKCSEIEFEGDRYIDIPSIFASEFKENLFDEIESVLNYPEPYKVFVVINSNDGRVRQIDYHYLSTIHDKLNCIRSSYCLIINMVPKVLKIAVEKNESLLNNFLNRTFEDIPKPSKTILVCQKITNKINGVPLLRAVNELEATKSLYKHH